MSDMEQMAYDAANMQIKDLEAECMYYRRLASHWRDIAFQLMSIDKLHDEFFTRMFDGSESDE